MKKILTFAGAMLITATLAACAPGIHGGKFGYNLTFQNGELVSHALGKPNAYIGADGSLRIGDHTIAVTTQQRALLKDYYGEARAIVEEGKATGKAGAELGAHAIGNVIKSIFSGQADEAGKRIDAQAQAIAASAQKICATAIRLHDTQRTIAAQLPAFQPYRTLDEQVHCNVTTGRSVTISSNSNSSTKITKTEKLPTAH